MTYKEIAQKLNITVAQVKAIEVKALRKLKTPVNAKKMREARYE